MLEHPDIQFPHRHFFYQIVYFTQTGGTHSIDFQHFEVTEGQIYLMAPGQIHSWHFTPETEGIIVNFNENFFSSVFQDAHFMRQFPMFHHHQNNAVILPEEDALLEISKIFEDLLAEFNQHHAFRTEALRGLLLLLITRLSRVASPTDSAGISKHNLQMMRQFEQLIDAHFKEKRLPKEYAELLFITPNHLNALCNQITGKSAGALIRERVLLEAQRLLSHSDLMISQIALKLHFEDNAYFSRFFKKYTGVPPEDFRATILRGSRSNP